MSWSLISFNNYNLVLKDGAVPSDILDIRE